jgi:hypothetical protein
MSLIDTLAALREKSVAFLDPDWVEDDGEDAMNVAEELIQGYVTVTDAFFEQAISEALGDTDDIMSELVSLGQEFEGDDLVIPAMISEDGEIEL